MEEATIIKEKTILMPLMAIGSSDTKPVVSLPPSAEEKTDFGPENGLKQEQDKEVAHSASLPLPKGSDSGETHRAVTERKRGMNNEEKRKLRSVSYQFGPGLLRRMNEDDVFMDNIRVKIANLHFLDDVVKDQYKRQKSVAPIVHDMASECMALMTQAEKESGSTLPKEARGWMLKELMLMAFMGAFVLEEEILIHETKKGENHNA